jgi:hypothetical protein
MSQYLTEARLLENVLWVKTIPLYKTSEARIKRLKELISQYDSPEKLQDVSVGEEIKANKSSAPVSEETFKQFHRLLESQIEACREQQEAAQVRNAERVREKTQESNLRAIRNRYEREIEAARRVAAEQQAANRAAQCVESASEGKQEDTGRVTFAGAIWQWIGRSCKGDHADAGGSKHKTRRKKKHRRKRKTRRTHKKKRMTKRRRKKRTKRKTRKH